ncbi:MAG: hypothetical protein KDC24_12105 [Saprospiraceae bacterium]|nr:hypothetical protein [Saprospiraceae bacterium]
MKSVYNFKTWLLLAAAMLMVGPAVWAGNKQEFSKTIKRNFPLTANGLASLDNQYGKVYVKTWDQDRVKVEVKITVRANSEQDAQKVFDKIKIEFAEAADKVAAKTVIDNGGSTWSWWGSSKVDYSIDYDVVIPNNARLDLANKYGDSFIGTINGATTLNIKYGNFQVESAKNDLSVFLGYGNGTIFLANNVVADGSYCQLKVKEAKSVKINSKYSKVNIEETGTLDANSQYDSYKIGYVHTFNNEGRYDNLEIGAAEVLNVTSKYAEVSIGELKSSANLDLKYGGANFGKVVKGFNNLNLNGSFADYKIKVEEGANYQVKASADYAGIKYPQVLKVVNEKEKGTYHEIDGYVGQKGARSVIKANLNYGGLKVW